MDSNPASPILRDYRKQSYLFLALGGVLLVIAALIGISDNPPGIACMLVGFFAVILGVTYFVARSGKRTPAQQLLYWTPRALCIASALFISLFALDVFDEGQGFWGTLLALGMHLLPTLLILLVLAVTWKHEWIGGIFFIVLAVLYVVSSWNKPFASWSTFLLISGPFVLIGVLFLLNWYYREELRGGSSASTRS